MPGPRRGCYSVLLGRKEERKKDQSDRKMRKKK
jgi:hypothetical protein